MNKFKQFLTEVAAAQSSEDKSSSEQSAENQTPTGQTPEDAAAKQTPEETSDKQAPEGENLSKALEELKSLGKASPRTVVRFCANNFNLDQETLEKVVPYVKNLKISFGPAPFLCKTDREYAWQFYLGSWPSLKKLILKNVNIGDEGVRALAQGDWPSVELLYIRPRSVGAVSDESIIALAQGEWPRLASLYLYNTNIANQGAKSLSLKIWKSLKNLTIVRARGVSLIKADGINALRILRKKGVEVKHIKNDKERKGK